MGKTRAALLALVGTWRDSQGSEYDVTTHDTVSLTVQTKRPNGQVKVTERLIHLSVDLQDNPCVAWGKTFVLQLPDSSVVDRIADAVVWISRDSGSSRTFHW